MKYYFLVTYLPEIQRDDKKVKLRFADLLAEREYMAPEDWRQIELVLLARDFLPLLFDRDLPGDTTVQIVPPDDRLHAGAHEQTPIR